MGEDRTGGLYDAVRGHQADQAQELEAKVMSGSGTTQDALDYMDARDNVENLDEARDFHEQAQEE
jgi:pyrroline-5-carboxylate reductase